RSAPRSLRARPSAPPSTARSPVASSSFLRFRSVVRRSSLMRACGATSGSGGDGAANALREAAHAQCEEQQREAEHERVRADQPQHGHRALARTRDEEHAENDRRDAAEEEPELSLDLLAQAD